VSHRALSPSLPHSHTRLRAIAPRSLLRYAFRKPHTLTDVVLRELSTKQDVRIKCKDLVKKIALYKNFLAVQLPKSINVYEISQSETGALKVKLPPLKIRESIECSLLVVCSRNLILCLDRRLTSLAFDGSREREWVLDAPIKYIKVVGGPPGCEGLLVGLKNGQVLRYLHHLPPRSAMRPHTSRARVIFAYFSRHA
jgi:intraflagellar transport protein 122